MPIAVPLILSLMFMAFCQLNFALKPINIYAKSLFRLKLQDTGVHMASRSHIITGLSAIKRDPDSASTKSAEGIEPKYLAALGNVEYCTVE